MNTLHKSALVITIVGAINWGIIGLFNQNFIANMFGTASVLTRTVYTIIAIAAILNIGLFFVDFNGERRHVHYHSR